MTEQATTIRPCPHCDQPMLYPTDITESEKVPYKQTGWIGENWLDPETHKYKPPIRRTFKVCGMCAATHWADEYSEDTTMNGDELRDQLGALAAMENGARMDLLDAMKRGEIPLTGNGKPARKRKAGKRPKSEHRAKNDLSPISCGCIPHETIQTYNGWHQRGRQVKRGEKRLPGFYHALFCKCQVKPIKSEVAA